jgi:hypothetical protein
LKALQNLPKLGFLVWKYIPSGNPGVSEAFWDERNCFKNRPRLNLNDDGWICSKWLSGFFFQRNKPNKKSWKWIRALLLWLKRGYFVNHNPF